MTEEVTLEEVYEELFDQYLEVLAMLKYFRPALGNVVLFNFERMGPFEQHNVKGMLNEIDKHLEANGFDAELFPVAYKLNLQLRKAAKKQTSGREQ